MENKINPSKYNLSTLKLTEKTELNLRKKHYGVFGHSGVQICSWTKKSLTGKGVCYKEKFYGVDCHSCMEMSPVVMWCQQNCTFCWRPMEYMRNINIEEFNVDEPKNIIENLTEERRKLLSGFGGNDNINMDKFNDCIVPSHYAISLSGEPTMYSKLGELVEYLKTLPKTKTIFIVSNGQEPEFFKKIAKNEKQQPTQMYISIDAPNEELFKKINKSLYSDGWDRLKQSLKNYSKLQTRKILRMTVIKGINDGDELLEQYKELIAPSNADIIEVKAYMHLGLARKRHTKEQMPNIEEVTLFAQKLGKTLGNYKIEAQMPNSLIVLLRRQDSNHKLRIEKFENEK